MNIKQLHRLVQTLTEVSEKNGYFTSINQLRVSVMQFKTQIASPQNAAQQQQLATTRINIENSKNQAINSLAEIQSRLKDYNLTKSLGELRIDSPYSDYANNLLDRVTLELQTNLEGLIAELSQYYQRLSSYQKFATSLNVVLGDFFQIEQPDKDELILFFEGDANVNDLKELSRVSTDWHQIVNCFGRLTNENDTSTYIVSIERGSLVETLAISATIIGGIIAASNKVLNLILKIYEVRKKALELKQMKLDGIGKAIEILEKQSTVNLSVESKEIVKELMAEYGWKEESELYHETETAAVKGVKKLIKFHNSGGKVDSNLLNPTPQQKESATRLKEKNIEFLKIEAELQKIVEGKQILLLVEGDMPDDEDSNDQGE